MASIMVNAVLDDERVNALSYEQIGALVTLARHWDVLGGREQARDALRLTTRAGKQIVAAVWPILTDADVATSSRRGKLRATAKQAADARWVDANIVSHDGIAEPPSASLSGSLSSESTQSSEYTETHSADSGRFSTSKKAVENDGEKRRRTSTSKTVAKPDAVSDDVWRDFLAVRKAKRLPLTETAWKAMLREAQKAALSVEAMVRLCVERSWGGFQASWLTDGRTNGYAPRGEAIRHPPGMPYPLDDCPCPRCLELLAAKETA